jgi:hypothetical protein
MSSSSTGPLASDVPAKTPRTEPGIPLGELQLATLALRAADAWDVSPLLALLWLSKAQLRLAAGAFKDSIGAAGAADDDLSPAAARLAELDTQIESSLKFVKNYLTEAYGSRSKGEAYYDSFGLVREGKGWGLGTARPARVENLTKLVATLKTSDYDQSKYGTAFWTAILAEYAPLVATSSDARSGSATTAGAKNTLEKPLRKMLRALRQHIKTNFPDTYKAEWRGFGFLKEDY